MIENLRGLNTLAEQCFDEKRAAQVEADSKQLKLWLIKLKPCWIMHKT